MIALAAALLLAAPGSARTPRFVVSWDDDVAPIGQALAREAEADRDAIARDLGRDFPGVVDLRIAFGRARFEALQPPGARAPAWAEGIAWPREGVVVIDGRLTHSLDEARRTFRHELSHVAIERLVPTAPHWFLEGFAVLEADAWSASRFATLMRAENADALFSLDSLAGAWPDDHLAEIEVAYAESASFVAWLYGSVGRDKVHAALARAAAGTSFEAALASATGSPLHELEGRWRRSLATRLTWIPILTGSGAIWIGITLLFLVAWRRVKQRKEERLRILAAEDRAELLLDAWEAAQAEAGEPEAAAEEDDGEPPPTTPGGETLH